MKKGNIILDLDQTLISAEPVEEFDLKKNKEKVKKFPFYDMEGYYIVFERPGLQKFLTYVFDNFNVSVWTAASKEYALFVIEKIILGKNSNRKLDFIFFDYHCRLSNKQYKNTKDLRMFWDIYKLKNYTNKNTIIIDDYDEVYNTQRENCIYAKEFKFTSKNSSDDTFLADLIPHLRELISKTEVASIVVKINSSNNSRNNSRRSR